MAKGFSAFTIEQTSISRELISKAQIGIAFDPSKSPSPEIFEFDAIWDTGATGSVISKNVVNKCGLKPIGMTEVHTANGKSNCNVYLVCIRLPNEVGFAQVRVTEGNFGGDILIGMDIIGSGDFAVSNYEGKTVFTYRHPSAARIDFVKDIKRLQQKTTGRNDPCPCGSGKKYKKCHGLNK